MLTIVSAKISLVNKRASYPKIASNFILTGQYTTFTSNLEMLVTSFHTCDLYTWLHVSVWEQ